MCCLLQAPAWPCLPAAYHPPKAPTPLPTGSTDEIPIAAAPQAVSSEGERVRRCIRAACEVVLESEKEVNELDAKVRGKAPLAAGREMPLTLARLHSSLPKTPAARPQKGCCSRCCCCCCCCPAAAHATALLLLCCCSAAALLLLCCCSAAALLLLCCIWHRAHAHVSARRWVTATAGLLWPRGPLACLMPWRGSPPTT
jgi:hypothetical protein